MTSRFRIPSSHGRTKKFVQQSRSIKGFIHEASLDSTWPASWPALVLVRGLFFCFRAEAQLLLNKEREILLDISPVGRAPLETIYKVIYKFYHSRACSVIKWIITGALCLHSSALSSSHRQFNFRLFVRIQLIHEKAFNPFALGGTRKNNSPCDSS